MQKEDDFKDVNEIDEKTEAIADRTEAEEKIEEKTEHTEIEEKTEHSEMEDKTEDTRETVSDSEDIGNSDDLNDVEVDDDEMTHGSTYIEIEDDEPERHHCGCNWGIAAHCAITAAVCFVIFFIILACSNRKQTIHLVIDDNSMTTTTATGSTNHYVTEERIPTVQPEINMAKQFHLNETSEENSAKLGIECTTVDQESVSQGLPKGVYVISVPEGSAAHIGGVLTGDIITAVDGQTIENTEDLLALMKTYEPGDKIRVSLVRYADGIVSKDVTIVLSK